MYLTDNTGSVTAITGACGCSDASYTYNPDGALIAKSAGSGGSLVTQNLLGYTGALTDTYAAGTTGYVHDGARWYNPLTGAFQTQDTNSYLNNPANGNRYAYAADNPINNTDPTGHMSGCKLLGWISLGVGVVGIGVSFFGILGAAGVLGASAVEAAGAVNTAWSLGAGLFGVASGLITQIC